MLNDTDFMAMALLQAEKAATMGEVPVGAVLVRAGEVIALAHNQPIDLHDPSAHAEMLALRAAAKMMGNYRLPGCTLYVTLEPCVMCAGAILHARLDRVVFAASDPKTGAAGGMIDVFSSPMNHKTQVTGGVMAEESAVLLRSFFASRRGGDARRAGKLVPRGLPI